MNSPQVPLKGSKGKDMKKVEVVETPDWHHMDERFLRQFQADLNAIGVKKAYRYHRETWVAGGMKGKMPDATLLHIAAEGRRHKDAFKPKPKKLVEVSDGGKHTDDDLF